MFVCVWAIRLTPCVFCVQFPGGDDYASDDDDENAGPSSPKPKSGGLFGGGEESGGKAKAQKVSQGSDGSAGHLQVKAEPAPGTFNSIRISRVGN